LRRIKQTFNTRASRLPLTLSGHPDCVWNVRKPVFTEVLGTPPMNARDHPAPDYGEPLLNCGDRKPWVSEMTPILATASASLDASPNSNDNGSGRHAHGGQLTWTGRRPRRVSRGRSVGLPRTGSPKTSQIPVTEGILALLHGDDLRPRP
jgi:hypothetical protein